MSRMVRAGAVFLCAALMLPWVGGVAIAFHHGHSPHHQEPSAHDAEVLDLIVHGHHHEPGAPAHQHHLVIAKPSPATSRPSVFLASVALLSWTAPTAPLTSGSVAVLPARSHAPPRCATVSSILRI